MNLMYVFYLIPTPTYPITTQVQTCNLRENMYVNSPAELYDIHAPKDKPSAYTCTRLTTR